jgi:site-specific DNA recombinase
MSKAPGQSLQCGVYARISLDQAGEGLGVARQVEDCTAKAKALGWVVAGTYTDNDVSASSDAPRPEYARLLADLEAGSIRAVVVYDLDRLTRKPAELEAFIDLSDRLGIALANVSGDVDLTTAAGRMVARIKGAVARQEAERIGERVKRQKQQRLNAGLPPGSRYRTFGYTRDWKVIDDEAAVVRDVFNRVAAGESVNSITKDLRRNDVQTASGKSWSFQATSRLLDSPIYAGLLTYKGEIVGKSAVPALISEALYQSAKTRETKPAWNTRKHLLSGIAICDVCKTPMNYSGGAYVCSRLLHGCGNIKIKAEWLDDVVNAYMSSMVMIDAMQRESEDTQEEQPDRVAEIDKQIEAARQANLDGGLDLADLLPMLKELRTRRAEAVRQQVQAVEVANWQTVADYDGADLSVKRSIVKRHIEAIIVMPAKRGLNRFDETRCYVLLTDGRKLPLAAINVIDFREKIPDYPVTYPIEARVKDATHARGGE